MNNLRIDSSSSSSSEDSVKEGLIKKEVGEDSGLGNESQTQQKEIENAIDDSPITVRIKTMDDQEKRIQVLLSNKVSDLKDKILEELEIPLERQRLIFLGRQLKDDKTLRESKIKDDVCILLVANRIQNRSEPPRRSDNIEPNSNNEGDFGAFIFNALNETAQMRRNRRLLFQQNASSFLRNIRLNVNESNEAIVQNITSTELLMDTRRPIEEMKMFEPESEDSSDSIDCFDFSKRKLKKGQWVDVKDTINQWLEAQIIDINDDKAYVHYNGWGTRWDEWIEIKSPRITVFRTHTIQAATSTYLSPCPNNPPDSADNATINIPSSSNDQLSKVIELSSKSLSLMKKLKFLKIKYNKRVKIQRDKKYELTRKELNKIEEEIKSFK